MMLALMLVVAASSTHHDKSTNPYAAEDVYTPLRVDGWKYSSAIDAITELPEAGASILSEDGRHKLTLSCRSGSRERPLSFRLEGPRYLGGETARVVVKVEHGKSWELQWTTMSKVAYNADWRSVVGLIGFLSPGTRAVIRVYNFEDQPVDAFFDLYGAGSAFRRVISACGKQMPLDEDRNQNF
jgi:hypothetical protein